MPEHIPDRTDAERRARMRLAMIISGLVDLAFAGFFLGWGSAVLGLEYRVAWLIAGALAVFGVVTLFVAVLVLGRKGTGRADAERRPDEGDDRDEPVVRR